MSGGAWSHRYRPSPTIAQPQAIDVKLLRALLPAFRTHQVAQSQCSGAWFSTRAHWVSTLACTTVSIRRSGTSHISATSTLKATPIHRLTNEVAIPAA